MVSEITFNNVNLYQIKMPGIFSKQNVVIPTEYLSANYYYSVEYHCREVVI